MRQLIFSGALAILLACSTANANIIVRDGYNSASTTRNAHHANWNYVFDTSTLPRYERDFEKAVSSAVVTPGAGFSIHQYIQPDSHGDEPEDIDVMHWIFGNAVHEHYIVDMITSAFDSTLEAVDTDRSTPPRWTEIYARDIAIKGMVFAARAVPFPGTLSLLGAGLIAAAGFKRWTTAFGANWT